MPTLTFTGGVNWLTTGTLSKTIQGLPESAKISANLSEGLSSANSFWDIRNKTVTTSNLDIDFGGSSLDLVGMGAGRNQCNDLVTFSYIDFFLFYVRSGNDVSIFSSDPLNNWFTFVTREMTFSAGGGIYAYSPEGYDARNDVLRIVSAGTSVIDLIIIGRK